MTATMLPPEGLALLAAVEAAPADDTARLVLADWLEENERAEVAARLRWWVGVRESFARAVADIRHSPDVPSDDADPVRDRAEAAEAAIRSDWMSKLCAFEVERVAVADPAFASSLASRVGHTRAEHSDPLPRPPLFARWQWAALGLAEQPAGPLSDFAPDATSGRGLSGVRALSYLAYTGGGATGTGSRQPDARAMQDFVWRIAEKVFKAAVAAEYRS